MILDYSNFVEVIAREADLTEYPYYPSDLDIQRISPRLISNYRHYIRSTHPLMRFGKNGFASIIRSRVDLFNAIESLHISPAENSIKRSLVDWLGSKCYVCSFPTIIVRDEKGETRIPHIKVRACPNCGWWESENTAFLDTDTDTESLGPSYDSFTLLRRACLREFAIFDNSAPLNALRMHLLRHPWDLNRISPRKLEDLVGNIFSNFFDCEAIHVGGPSDGGYDLILLMKDIPALVQVKQHINPRKAEPVSSIREFIGAMVLTNSRVGFFVTTAGKFSAAAKNAATSISEEVIQRLDLVDASILMDILKLTSHNAEPWRLYAHKITERIQDFRNDQEFIFHLI